MKTVDAVKGKWAQVFDHYGLPPITGKRHFKGEAPCCGRKGKFRIDDKDGSGSFICACGAAGNGWKLLQIATGMEFKDLAQEVDSIIGNVFTAVKQEQKEKPKHQDAVMKFRKAGKVEGSGVQNYLQSRGIFEMPRRAVKCSNGNMFAIAADHKGNPCYSHETYLDGAKKADVETQKRMTGLQNESFIEHAESISIRLFDVASTLGVAEGIETALSCKQIYRCSMWSTMNSSFMKKFRAPDGVDHLMIFADNDKNGTGLAAAFECGNRNILSKNTVKKVTIRWPADVEDFNDMLTDGSEVYEWVLTKG